MASSSGGDDGVGTRESRGDDGVGTRESRLSIDSGAGIGALGRRLLTADERRGGGGVGGGVGTLESCLSIDSGGDLGAGS